MDVAWKWAVSSSKAWRPRCTRSGLLLQPVPGWHRHLTGLFCVAEVRAASLSPRLWRPGSLCHRKALIWLLVLEAKEWTEAALESAGDVCMAHGEALPRGTACVHGVCLPVKPLVPPRGPW